MSFYVTEDDYQHKQNIRIPYAYLHARARYEGTVDNGFDAQESSAYTCHLRPTIPLFPKNSCLCAITLPLTPDFFYAGITGSSVAPTVASTTSAVAMISLQAILCICIESQFLLLWESRSSEPSTL
jgi:hypothetical protein